MTVPIYSMADTWNAGATTFQSILMNVTNGAAGNPVGAAASELISLQTNATERFGVRCPHFSLGTDATPFLNLSDIWNTSATITGLKYNVIDTASNAASLLVDVQSGSASRFQIVKNGTVNIFPISNGQTVLTTRFGSLYFGGASIGDTSQPSFFLDASAVQFCGRSTALIGWSSSATNAAAGLDTILTRDAANTLAQRNGTTAQTFRVYNTFTDASNYERLAHLWASNVAILDVQKAGTGSQRAASFRIGGTEIVGLTAAGVLSLTANNSTGAGSALLGTNSPATTLTSPYTWITVISNDGSTCYLPVWK